MSPSLPTEPPLVDQLERDDRLRCFTVQFVPEDRVSRREKESVRIPQSGPEGTAIAMCLTEMARALGGVGGVGGEPIERIVHSGGDNFVFWFPGQRWRELSDPALAPGAADRLLELLQRLAMQAQGAYRVDQTLRQRGRASA